MKLYCFDGERESIEFNHEELDKNATQTAIFAIVIDGINKQTLIQKSLLELNNGGYISFSDAKGERIQDSIVQDLKAKVQHNLSELEILSTEFGIKLTTKKELADLMGPAEETEQENGN